MQIYLFFQFIAVHVRRGDFSVYCGNGDCYPALSVYARQVEEVKQEIFKVRGVDIEHVVVTAGMCFPALHFLTILLICNR